jgi:hypothetical protein
MLTKTYQPCSNAPMTRGCDIPGCNDIAVADTLVLGVGQWGYLCIEHFKTMGSHEDGLVNNITDSPLTVTFGA